jgi:hypothetical protein
MCAGMKLALATAIGDAVMQSLMEDGSTMSKILNAISFAAAVALIGGIIAAQRAYQQSWTQSQNSSAYAITQNGGNSGPELIVSK